ncbi:unnamed protein product [Gordionus sp. m RMFG-2023]
MCSKRNYMDDHSCLRKCEKGQIFKLRSLNGFRYRDHLTLLSPAPSLGLEDRFTPPTSSDHSHYPPPI